MKELILYGMFLVLIFLGYFIPLNADRINKIDKKWILVAVFLSFAVIGFFASAYGLKAYFFMFLSLLGGYLIGLNRVRIEKTKEAEKSN